MTEAFNGAWKRHFDLISDEECEEVWFAPADEIVNNTQSNRLCFEKTAKVS